jgi:uncharacterized membrane-anchored protein
MTKASKKLLSLKNINPKMPFTWHHLKREQQMRKTFFLAATALLLFHFAFAGDGGDTTQADMMKMIEYQDSVNNAMNYQTGRIILPGGIAALKIPAGFKFLAAEQSQFVLKDVWGNPARPDVLGMVFPSTGAPYADSSYAYVVSFDEVGYVKDEDADKIDYSDLLEDIHKNEPEENKERLKEGYETIHIVGWAQTPFYDKDKKVLHWAKEIKFGEGASENTLNYDIRVLGRKGVLSFNAVAGMSGMPMVKQDIEKILAMPEFTAGNKYGDFDSKTDNIAAYTIGGLVAGKLLMKAGIWVVIAKFWKLILGGIIAAFYGVRKFITGRRKDEHADDNEPLEKADEEETKPAA